MNKEVLATLVRVATFLVVCAVGVFALFAVFADMRFGAHKEYKAQFTDISGLKKGDFVRIAGVEVGQVQDVSIDSEARVLVDFYTDDSVVLTRSSKALIRYDNLIGDRFMELQQGPGSGEVLAAGSTITVDHTQPALDLDELIGGFRPLFKALDPDQVNALSTQLVQVFQGQDATIGSFLEQTAAMTSTLANRDQLIGEVIGNLNAVLGSLGGQSEQFDKAVDSLSQLVAALSARRTDITNAVAHSDNAANTVADLMAQARPPLQKVITQTDRAAGIVVADHDYVDNILNTLPDKYRAMGRQAMYGDYFAFYLCDLILKLNGKGGQPVYVKVAEQVTGRFAVK
ncbi:MCE-family protein MCE3b [Mycobacteroides abscessus]|uniref:MCE family protein n=1 Tax=Mycobacteroides abscessus TaxID=36809 RepID=UPI0005E4799B|nr:MCE family protein [Mycobacteroides abscessus]CQA03198.1 MCE-family protein MCE3b [Mycobacteroides abscessus]